MLLCHQIIKLPFYSNCKKEVKREEQIQQKSEGQKIHVGVKGEVSPNNVDWAGRKQF